MLEDVNLEITLSNQKIASIQLVANYTEVVPISVEEPSLIEPH